MECAVEFEVCALLLFSRSLHLAYHRYVHSSLETDGISAVCRRRESTTIPWRVPTSYVHPSPPLPSSSLLPSSLSHPLSPASPYLQAPPPSLPSFSVLPLLPIPPSSCVSPASASLQAPPLPSFSLIPLLLSYPTQLMQLSCISLPAHPSLHPPTFSLLPPWSTNS